MIVKPIKTRLVQPNDDLIAIITESVPQIRENSILAITSKVVSLWQNRIVPINSTIHDELVKKEADQYLDRDLAPKGMIMHTIKNNTLVGSAGIDRSLRLKSYILWPDKPRKTADTICSNLKIHYGIKNLGIIITDSHSVPLRRGAIGFTIAYSGFAPLKDYRALSETRSKKFTLTQANIADGLAASAVVCMGEGAEQTPLALISDIPSVNFDENFGSELPNSSFIVPVDEDLFSAFLKNAPWHKGGV